MKVGLYIHSPFCLHKCGYCDFNSWAEVRLSMQLRWIEALEKQIDFWAQKASELKVEVDSIFWGGGTPSLLANEIIIRAGEKIKNSFRMSEDLEFSIETNPETINESKIESLMRAGANRLSLGIQSFQDSFLKTLERQTSRDSNLKALDLLKKNWKGRLSIDLMFGLPDQTLGDWENDLQEALDRNFSHLSAYQLTLSTQRSKAWKQPSEELLVEMTEITENKLKQNGLEQYEVSNFSHKGEESRHNLKYWRLNPFLGFGPGAAGLLGPNFFSFSASSQDFGFHQKQPDNFEVWERGAGNEGFELANLKARNREQHLEELLMMNLRLTEGLEDRRLPPSARSALGELQVPGFIEFKGGYWKMTARGLRILDYLVPKIYKKIEENRARNLDSAEIDPTFS